MRRIGCAPVVGGHTEIVERTGGCAKDAIKFGVLIGHEITADPVEQDFVVSPRLD